MMEALISSDETSLAPLFDQCKLLQSTLHDVLRNDVGDDLSKARHASQDCVLSFWRAHSFLGFGGGPAARLGRRWGISASAGIYISTLGLLCHACATAHAKKLRV